MSRPCHVLRVFTRGDEGGNHLGVVNDVVGVSDAHMQKVATGLGFSETIFVDWTDPGADPAVRIFTPVEELPFAGHPLVGAAWMLAALGPVPARALRASVGTFTCATDASSAHVTASIPVQPIEGDVQQVAQRAGMPTPETSLCLALPKHYYMARYATFDEVGKLDPDMDALDVFGFAAFARVGAEVKLRFFAPGTGVQEDPATGSAAVALAATFRTWGEPDGQVTITQGDEIGHPSTIQLSWSPLFTTIGGSVRHDEVVLVD